MVIKNRNKDGLWEYCGEIVWMETKLTDDNRFQLDYILDGHTVSKTMFVEEECYLLNKWGETIEKIRVSPFHDTQESNCKRR